MSCEIKVRLPDGTTADFKCEPDDPLSLVYVGLQERTGEQDFLLSIPYPRRIFQISELDLTTVKAAGLSPKGTLIMQRQVTTEMKQDKTPIVPKAPAGVQHVKTAKEYETLRATHKSKLVVVDFSAEWCGPCKAIAPEFEALAKATPTAVFIHLDVDEVKVPDSSDVEGIPTFKFFKDGKLVHHFAGADAQSLKTSVSKYNK